MKIFALFRALVDLVNLVVSAREREKDREAGRDEVRAQESAEVLDRVKRAKSIRERMRMSRDGGDK